MDQSTADQTTAIWQERIDSWLASGISIAKWCKEHQVVYNQFLYQKDKFNGKRRKRARAISSQFIELTDVTSKDPGIAIECGDVKICLTSDFDEATLLRCMQVVRRAI